MTFKSCFNFSKNNWKQSISQILQSNFWRVFEVRPNSAACLAMSHDWKFFKGTEWNLGPQGRRKLCKFELFCTCTHLARFLIFYIRLKLRFVCWIWDSGIPRRRFVHISSFAHKAHNYCWFLNLKDNENLASFNSFAHAHTQHVF